MTDFEQYNNREESFKVEIGKEEWEAFSYKDKVRLLYRLRQSQHQLANQIANAVDLLLEEERLQNEIDYEATFKSYYGDSM